MPAGPTGPAHCRATTAGRFPDAIEPVRRMVKWVTEEQASGEMLAALAG